MASGTSPWTLKHLASVPYSDPPSRLRTLDVWLPQPPAGSSDKGTAPPSDSGTWLVYIHGGAWRDPLKDSRCIEPALSHLSSDASAISASTLNHVTGVASLNYRLSPYPSHPSHPSDPNDAERSARHPTHVRDVAAGLRFLQRQHGMKRWIGIGHSCGATLLAQLVSGIGLDEQGGGETSFAGGPEALILLEGIYNIPLMLKNHSPPGCPQNIADIYKTFVAEAFGDDDDDNNNGAAYLAVSPVSGKYNVQQWPEGKLLVLCHSYDDELVERAQRDVMCVALDREGWSIVMEVGDEEDEVRAEGRRVLNVRDLQGRHDWIWEDGKQIATLILEVVQRLMKR